jgi:solute carrier family 25 2-oxodicarboxylate transporter 21
LAKPLILMIPFTWKSHSASDKKHHQPFSHRLIAGGIAGTTEILVMYPLDVVKTRAQLNAAPGQSIPIWSTMVNIVKQDGFARLYRGIAPPIAMEAPKRAVKFAANSTYSAWMADPVTGKLTQRNAILCGMAAGITEAFVVVPFELVKIRLQAKENLGVYKNTTDALKKILKNEGPLALYKGLESTMWRNAAWNGGYFGLIHWLTIQLPKPKTEGQTMMRDFVAGAVSGTFGTMLNTPFDTAKTRIQNQGALLKPGQVPKYGWTLSACKTIYQEEGALALYKGFLPKVLRLGPGGGILLVVFKKVSQVLEEWDKKKKQH